MNAPCPAVATLTETISVLLVDDHEITRAGIKQLLNEAPGFRVIGEATTCDEALSLIDHLEPDVVVLDIRLRVGTGLDVARTLKSTGSPAKVLVFSSYDQFQYVSSMAKLGVMGYLLKTASSEELKAAIRDVAVGKFSFAPEVTPRIMSLIEGIPFRPVPAASRVGGLTERESQIMEYMGRGCKNTEIAGAIGIGLKTVEVHVGKILRKYGATNRTQAVLRALYGERI